VTAITRLYESGDGDRREARDAAARGRENPGPRCCGQVIAARLIAFGPNAVAIEK
jgi:hypothetical protein